MPTPSSLSNFIDAAERSGKFNLWTQDIARALPDMTREALRQALRRQQSKGRITQTSRGSNHWVIIPLRYATAGAPPLESWLHAYLDKTLGIPYYVGLLSAAETYGASPYATMVTQIITLKPRRPLQVGRHKLVFLGCKDVGLMPTRWHETTDGRFKVSTPELTALELVYRQQLVGGASRVLSVLQAMTDTLSEGALLEALDRMNEVPAAQRMGVLLSMDDQPVLTNLIQNWLANKRTRNIPLSPGQAPDESSQLDAQFKVLVPINFQLSNS